mmetsp:Transcript_26590/g.78250  ORF Transcript_26590/g.78250 Transcript_26590/m.78250 type:complete len:280 (+) Transcript_26590:1215-2054(+)
MASTVRPRWPSMPVKAKGPMECRTRGGSAAADVAAPCPMGADGSCARASRSRSASDVRRLPGSRPGAACCPSAGAGACCAPASAWPGSVRGTRTSTAALAAASSGTTPTATRARARDSLEGRRSKRKAMRRLAEPGDCASAWSARAYTWRQRAASSTPAPAPACSALCARASSPLSSPLALLLMASAAAPPWADMQATPRARRTPARVAGGSKSWTTSSEESASSMNSCTTLQLSARGRVLSSAWVRRLAWARSSLVAQSRCMARICSAGPRRSNASTT